MQSARTSFRPNGLPVLIGSLPVGDHEQAAQIVFRHTPDIPLWVQLPVYPEEGMIAQFLPGMPGLVTEAEKWFIETTDASFPDALFRFYEEYLAVMDGRQDIESSRFVLKPDTARGFFVFKEHVRSADPFPKALKGQITGPVTFATAVKDQSGRAIHYDEQVRDAAIKLLAMKARFQVRQLSRFGRPVILFLDEPALAGFGSSEFISISGEEVRGALDEVIEAVHAEGGLAGIHVCANTEWDLIMGTRVDIVNLDAYGYFDRFILYPEAIQSFLGRGGMIAWGVVPTGDLQAILEETPESLYFLWQNQVRQIEKLGVRRSEILSRTFITPSCGTGSLSLDHAERVLTMTRELSRMIRENHSSDKD